MFNFDITWIFVICHDFTDDICLADDPLCAARFPNQDTAAPLLFHNIYNFCNTRIRINDRWASGHYLTDWLNRRGSQEKEPVRKPNE